jgi:antitoxin component YwqK of YwqJK toxin-antitoxin module
MDQPNPRYPNGNLRFEGGYRNGEMHGAWKFYRADASLMRSGSFDSGKQVGIWRTYDRTGKLVKETNFGD